jgi:16S rRNA (adenine1518-N6/adenine1519-N6)-dimethyltransferase
MVYSRLANPRATREVLEQHGLATRKSLGQHFLVDDNVVGRILELAALQGDETVLEVGPGIGTLTITLCERARAVLAIEADPGLADALVQTAEECDNLSLITGDAVRVPPAEMTVDGRPVDAFVSNLPYAVAATLALRCFEELPELSSATVMVQAEVAARMSAVPGTKDYGAYTVKLALRTKVAGSFPVPRTCFKPPPRVDSTVIRLERRSDIPDALGVQAASQIADAAFSQRRKTLRNSLSAGLRAAPDAVAEMLEDAGIDPSSRAEAHEPSEFLTMASFAEKHHLLP